MGQQKVAQRVLRGPGRLAPREELGVHPPWGEGAERRRPARWTARTDRLWEHQPAGGALTEAVCVSVVTHRLQSEAGVRKHAVDLFEVRKNDVHRKDSDPSPRARPFTKVNATFD